jgi:hypothetical protein
LVPMRFVQHDREFSDHAGTDSVSKPPRHTSTASAVAA